MGTECSENSEVQNSKQTGLITITVLVARFDFNYSKNRSLTGSYCELEMQIQDIRVLLLQILAILILLSAFQPPLNIQNVPLNRRLLTGFRGSGFDGRDVFSLIQRQPWLFWRNTGETPQSFLQLVADVSPALFRLTRDGLPRQRLGRSQLNITNQVLLALMWLRKYLHVESLALWFDTDPSTVVRIIYRVIPEMWRYFQNQIRWLNVNEWANIRGNWPEFPNAVGAIDATPHEIYRPITEPQRSFYSGHRHYHCFNTQLIIDNLGHLRYVQAGFLGSTHDATSYRLMTRIGPGQPLDLPQGAKLLADKAYPDGGSLLTAVRANQMHLLNPRERRRARRFNKCLSRRRIKVEHVFKEIKVYKAISQLWRHPRWLLPVCVELASFLAERRVRLFEHL
ncbi:uncharacterized protein LOC116289769 [Actinia tenebrosa]|uniref:Uncharacterized protein LOC116289769 n=1 Tax=Actinia tenebrosa TaxID=6105 RepID=A0A6P8HIZ1_ACTTE|nr:uncharacterized protein LOC116289769 [Actinia tenebrosa]